MKNYFPGLLVLCLAFQASGQSKDFSDGYLVFKDGKKTTCLVENLDLLRNPQKLRIRYSPAEEQQLIDLSEVKEFGIYNGKKFIRETVKIDRPKETRMGYSITRNPEWNEETVFLNVILEGKASLYSFADKNGDIYFYRKDSHPAEQLIHKNYVTENNTISLNADFRQQLFTQLNCGDQEKNIKELVFKEVNLIKYFKAYNQCEGSASVDYEPEEKGSLFFKATPGLYLADMMTYSPFRSPRMNFGTNAGFRAGLEVEYFPKRRSEKWSLIAEPSFQSLKVNKEFGYQLPTTLTYHVIELPMGFRYNFFTKDGLSRFFINAGPQVSFNIKARIEPEDRSTLPIASPLNFFGGAGYYLKNKLSLEARYTYYNEFVDSNTWTGHHRGYSLILGIPLNHRK